MRPIQTYTGLSIDPRHLRPCEVCITDIAHALSMLCRYTGHVAEFYSVAEHCVHVSNIVPQAVALSGLLHDASEAYIGDVAGPLKGTGVYTAYRHMERDVQRTILAVYKLPLVQPAEVTYADHYMIWPEVRSIMNPGAECWERYNFPWDGPTVQIERWLPARAESEFIRRFNELWDSTL